MNHRRSIDRRSWALLLTGALALLGTSLAAGRWSRHGSVPAPQLLELRGERERLAGNTDPIRLAQDAEAGTVRDRAWTDERLVQLEERLVRHWRWEWDDSRDRSHVHLHTRSDDLMQWSSCLATLRALALEPGVIVELIDIEASGVAAHRRFVRLSLGVRIIRPDAAKGDAERAAPSRGPLPVAATKAPDPTRKVGPVIPFPSIPARPSGSSAGSVHEQPKPTSIPP